MNKEYKNYIPLNVIRRNSIRTKQFEPLVFPKRINDFYLFRTTVLMMIRTFFCLMFL